MSHYSGFSAANFFQDVPPKQGTPGVEQPSAPAGGAPQQAPPPGGGLFTLLLPFLILVPFLIMSFRRSKKEQEARKNLKKGDRVVTQAGLIGELVEMDERIAKVKIAPGTTVQVVATAVSPFEAQASKTEKELADLKEAKAAADKK